MAHPFVTVIVPVRNEEKFLEATLRPLLSQSYPVDRYEVIVADGESEDRTASIVRRLQADHSNLRLIDNPRRLSSAARNFAVKQGRGDFFLIVDGHCEIRNPDYLRHMVEVFEWHAVESVGRPQPLDVTGATPLQRAIALARSSRLGHNPASFIYSSKGAFVPPQSVAVAYRRDVFDRIGYFDECFDACEDVEFNTRLAAAGGRCYFAPALAVHYHPRSSLPRLVRQMYRYGRGRARLSFKHLRTLSIPPLVPAAFLLLVTAMTVAGLFLPAAVPAVLAVLLIYAATLVATSIVEAARNRAPELAPLMPPVFASIHLGAGLGVLAEFGSRLMPSLRGGPNGERAATAFSSVARDDHASRHHEAALNALTFDVEEYFQVNGFAGAVDPALWGLYEPRAERSTDELLAVLNAANVRATFFVLGWLARRRPGLVRRIAAAGHEVASHGYWHQLVTTRSRDQFRADVRAAKAVLEDALGGPVTGYRAPSFSISPSCDWAFGVLVEEGYRFDSSVATGRRHSCGHLAFDGKPFVIRTSSGSLREFPMPAGRLLSRSVPVGGGGYFRLMPYRLTRRSLRRLNAYGTPACVYLHPWEIDGDQPRLTVPVSKAFRHRVNLHRTLPRLERLLRDFRFDTVSAAMAMHLDAAEGDRKAA
jgi:polysaccharide deacetylase family protein (PEP-CTERM system associated)